MDEELGRATEELADIDEGFGKATHGVGRGGLFAGRAAGGGGLVAASGGTALASVNTPEARLLGGAYDASKVDAYLGTILAFTGDPGTDPEKPQNVELHDPGLLVVAVDGTIQSVEPGDSGSGNYNTYDYRGHVIMAGFVDAHVHYVQMDAIAAFGEQILQWLQKYVYRAEKKFKDDNHTRAVV
jgi:guanine deaminase